MLSQASLDGSDDNCRYFIAKEWRAIVAFSLILLNQKPLLARSWSVWDIDAVLAATGAPIKTTCKELRTETFLNSRRDAMTWLMIFAFVLGLGNGVSQNSPQRITK